MNWWEDPEKVKQRAEKYRKNFRKKHGVNNPQQLKEIKEKTNNTLRRKYGCVGYDGELGEKSKDTTKKRYGKRNIMKTSQGRKLYKDGMKKTHGVENPYHLKEIRNKTSEALKDRPSKLKGKTYEEILGPEVAERRKKELKKSGAYGQSVTPRISAPQKELFKLVQQKYPTAVLEYPVLDYCLDICLLYTSPSPRD